eukprot:SM000049S16688  [mRNA]  locus=s49:35564:38839:- [translate_table: standard]
MPPLACSCCGIGSPGRGAGRAYSRRLSDLGRELYRVASLSAAADRLERETTTATAAACGELSRLQDSLRDMPEAERDALLRQDLLLLAPVVREVFSELPSTNYTFVLPYEDEVDAGAAVYLAGVIAATQLEQGVLVLPLATTGDGSCLLHAVSRGIWGVELFSDHLREQLAEELTDHSTWYEARIPVAEVAEAAKQARERGHFLSMLHIVALCHVVRRPILLFASEEAVAQWGCGYNGVAGLFAPLRLEPGSWRTAWPLAVGWASNHHNHFVPLVWTASEAPPRWRPQDETAAASTAADPFAVGAELRAVVAAAMAVPGTVEPPVAVLALVEELRAAVVQLRGHLLAASLAPGRVPPPLPSLIALPSLPPSPHGTATAGPPALLAPSVPSLAIAPERRASPGAVARWRSVTRHVQCVVRLRQGPLVVHVGWPRGGRAPVAGDAGNHFEHLVSVTAGDDPYKIAHGLVEPASAKAGIAGPRKLLPAPASKQKADLELTVAPEAPTLELNGQHDRTRTLMPAASCKWVDLANEITGRLEGMAVADIALQLLGKRQAPTAALSRAVLASPSHRQLAVATVRLTCEYRLLEARPLPGLAASLPDAANLLIWHVHFNGVSGATNGNSPPSAVAVVLEIRFTPDYPLRPPAQLRFLPPLPMAHKAIDAASGTLRLDFGGSAEGHDSVVVSPAMLAPRWSSQSGIAPLLLLVQQLLFSAVLARASDPPMVTVLAVAAAEAR